MAKQKPKEPRPANEIMAEYGRVCAAIGDLQYKREHGIPKALAELYAKAEALNLEHAAAVAEQNKETKSDG